MFSTEVRVAFAPARTYKGLLASDASVSWWQTLHRPAFIVLIIGVVLPAMALHRLTFGTVVNSAAVWSIAPAIEYLAAMCVIASVASRRLSMARALDLWFAGQLPYSFWLLTLPITTTLFRIPPLDLIALTAIAPTIWTTFIIAAFCRTILGVSSRGAWVRAGLHVAAFIVVASTLFIISAGGGVAVGSYMTRRWGL
jgi:hypothetical protein